MWHQLEPTSAHIAYVLIGTLLLAFSLISLIAKEQLFVGEAIIGTLFGCLIGPHVFNWFNPFDWTSDVDGLTLELSRLILVIQLFSCGAELPPKYMLRHFRSLNIVLFGAMIFGWLILSLMVYALFNVIGFSFSDSMLVGATFVATDPVLAAAIVGKSKFAERIRVDVKNLIQAESGANDGLAFPFVTLSINLVINRPNNVHPGEIIKDWILVGILYQCALGIVIGSVIGWCGRNAVKFVRRKRWIDLESSLVFYVALSLICTGLCSILGCDDLLASFSAGCAFSWGGNLNQGLIYKPVNMAYSSETGSADANSNFANDANLEEEGEDEEIQISSIIDLLLNTAYFVYFGSIIPWSDYHTFGWRLVVLSLSFIFIARIPILLVLQPIVPDLRSWKDALFVGHFGPKGVGSIFCCLLAKSMLKQKSDNLASHEILYNNIWTITTFVVFVSVIVHGFSICCFTIYNTAKKVSIQKVSGLSTSRPMKSSNSVELDQLSNKKSKILNSTFERDATTSTENSPVLEEMIGTSTTTFAADIAPVLFAEDSRRRKVSRLAIANQSKMSLSNSQFPKYAYVYQNSMVFVDGKGEVLDEFEIKSNDKPNDGKLLAYRSMNEIIVENSKHEAVRRYVIENTI
ncbi:hypothetical protein CANARDRAFT_29733 [[Candida] arabinofermentans NRRL YB-2248]|uniref:Cation/H+ exchanger transmembrane domain-containing protein n=1 Tax=[Candida] arabinofermentans NRRL YB-2248 TaxID=983967 RepID=A0A1E4SW99_9ASCO|nr:hypothetical protein CANARDRAFT_29733 [[Candida] arabinofermentans NRRL YB-2248]